MPSCSQLTALEISPRSSSSLSKLLAIQTDYYVILGAISIAIVCVIVYRVRAYFTNKLPAILEGQEPGEESAGDGALLDATEKEKRVFEYIY